MRVTECEELLASDEWDSLRSLANGQEVRLFTRRGRGDSRCPCGVIIKLSGQDCRIGKIILFILQNPAILSDSYSLNLPQTVFPLANHFRDPPDPFPTLSHTLSHSQKLLPESATVMFELSPYQLGSDRTHIGPNCNPIQDPGKPR